MARLTKNNKRSIKSTWREINWHVEGSKGGVAVSTGWDAFPSLPHSPLGTTDATLGSRPPKMPPAPHCCASQESSQGWHNHLTELPEPQQCPQGTEGRWHGDTWHWQGCPQP